MLAILDYKAGNQTSVQRALTHIGANSVITADPETVFAADGIIFPGVGAAGQAMGALAEAGLDTVLAKAVQQNRPVLGICLGCQILLAHSEENNTPTLGLFSGLCRRFDPALTEPDGTPIRIPHMGWNSLKQKKADPLFAGIADGAAVYFVHSYYVEVPEEYVIATSHHGLEFCAVYGREGLWGIQFHPEKSGRPGLAMLDNFNRYCLNRQSREAAC